MIAFRRLTSKVASPRSIAALGSIQRKIGTTNGENNVTEVEIKVPWGKVAGKLWNPNSKKQPILALHGWQDNAATFDKLVPLLPKDTSVLAIDLPGHGFSSWLPDGMVYSRFMYVQVINRIKQHYGWDKIGLLGHSLGGMFCYTFSALYPNDVKFVTALDYFKYAILSVKEQTNQAAEELTTLLELEKSGKSRVGFTEEQTIAKLIESTDSSLDETASRILMSRGVTRNGNGTVYSNRDPKVKFYYLLASFTDDYMLEKASLIKAPYMILKADEWHYNGEKSKYMEALEALKKSSSDCRFFFIPGKHHFHLTNPQPVADAIIPFLEKYN